MWQWNGNVNKIIFAVVNEPQLYHILYQLVIIILYKFNHGDEILRTLYNCAYELSECSLFGSVYTLHAVRKKYSRLNLYNFCLHNTSSSHIVLLTYANQQMNEQKNVIFFLEILTKISVRISFIGANRIYIQSIRFNQFILWAATFSFSFPLVFSCFNFFSCTGKQ